MRFLTFSCAGQLPLRGNDAIKQLFVDRLAKVRRTHPFRLVAWVVMPDHVHLLVLPDGPGGGVAKLMHAIKRPVAEAVLRRWRALEAPILQTVTGKDGTARFWQPGGGHDHNVRDDRAMEAFIDYIHENPCRRGLVDLPEEWTWSSARWYEGIESVIDCDPPEE